MFFAELNCSSRTVDISTISGSPHSIINQVSITGRHNYHLCNQHQRPTHTKWNATNKALPRFFFNLFFISGHLKFTLTITFSPRTPPYGSAVASSSPAGWLSGPSRPWPSTWSLSATSGTVQSSPQKRKDGRGIPRAPAGSQTPRHWMTPTSHVHSWKIPHHMNVSHNDYYYIYIYWSWGNESITIPATARNAN